MTLNCLIDEYSKEDLETMVKKSYSMAELIKKIGYATRGGNNHITVKKRLKEYGISTEHFRSNLNRTKREPENVFIENSTASQKVLREWYKKGEYKCSVCGLLPIWMGKDLTLILDHINGINNDDRLENLRWVCPNCNQQLETTGYKNIVYKRKKQ